MGVHKNANSKSTEKGWNATKQCDVINITAIVRFLVNIYMRFFLFSAFVITPLYTHFINSPIPLPSFHVPNRNRCLQRR